MTIQKDSKRSAGPAAPNTAQLEGIRATAKRVLAGAEGHIQKIAAERRRQVQLIESLEPPWRLLDEAMRQEIRLVLNRAVPRLRDSGEDVELVTEVLFKLAALEDSYIQLSCALQARPEGPFVPMDEETLYHDRRDWFGSYVRWARYAKAPLAYHFWAAVGIVGAACRSSWFIIDHDKAKWPSQYIFLVGDPAVGKGDAMWAAKDVVRRANLMIPPQWRDLVGIRLLASDTTQEEMVRSLAYQEGVPVPDQPGAHYDVPSTGLCMWDEVTTFLGKKNWADTKRIPFLTTIATSPDYDYRTKTGGKLHLRQINLSIIGCSAPSWLKNSITSNFFEGGFLDRINLIYRTETNRDYAYPPPRDPVVEYYLAELLVKLTSRLAPEEIYVSPEALAWFEHRYKEVTEASRGYTKPRWAGHLWRTAMVLAIGQWAETVAADIHVDRKGDLEQLLRLPPPVILREHVVDADVLMAVEGPWFTRFLDIINTSDTDRALELVKDTLRKYPGISPSRMLYSHLRHHSDLFPNTMRIQEYLNLLMAVDEVKRVGQKYWLTVDAPKEAVAVAEKHMRAVK